MKVNDYFEFDDEHPIPNLDVVDINTVKTNGGSDLFVIVATPLADDPRSLKRLLRKIERYLEFLNSEEFLAQSGPPTTANTNIIVKLHPESSRAAFELVERSRERVISNNANLVIDMQV